MENPPFLCRKYIGSNINGPFPCQLCFFNGHLGNLGALDVFLSSGNLSAKQGCHVSCWANGTPPLQTPWNMSNFSWSIVSGIATTWTFGSSIKYINQIILNQFVALLIRSVAPNFQNHSLFQNRWENSFQRLPEKKTTNIPIPPFPWLRPSALPSVGEVLHVYKRGIHTMHALREGMHKTSLCRLESMHCYTASGPCLVCTNQQYFPSPFNWARFENQA